MEQKKRNIILIGFMGSGKTSVGIRLSYRLKRTFLDTDKQIERKQGRSISDIFAREGEQAFRQMETDYLKELLTMEGEQIFSVGGGTPLKEENRGLLRQLGKVVYLQASPEEVYERLKGDTTRPLLQTPDARSRIEELLSSRRKYYEAAADMTVCVDGKAVEEVVEMIAETLEKENKL